MKQLLIPFKKNKTSLGQAYYNNEPTLPTDTEKKIIEDLAVFLPRPKEKNEALKGVFFNKEANKIAVTNRVVLLEIKSKKFTSNGIFPIKGKSLESVKYPDYLDMFPTDSRSDKYSITVKDWINIISNRINGIKESEDGIGKSKKIYIHLERSNIAVLNMELLLMLLQKAKQWGNDTIKADVPIANNNNGLMLHFYFNSPYGAVKVWFAPMGKTEGPENYSKLLENNVFGFTKNNSYYQGMLSISKDDFYKPLEVNKSEPSAADAQAQRIRILKLKYKYAPAAKTENSEAEDLKERLLECQKVLKEGKKITYGELLELLTYTDMTTTPRLRGLIYSQNDQMLIGINSGYVKEEWLEGTKADIFDLVKTASTATIKVK